MWFSWTPASPSVKSHTMSEKNLIYKTGHGTLSILERSRDVVTQADHSVSHMVQVFSGQMWGAALVCSWGIKTIYIFFYLTFTQCLKMECSCESHYYHVENNDSLNWATENQLGTLTLISGLVFKGKKSKFSICIFSMWELNALLCVVSS